MSIFIIFLFIQFSEVGTCVQRYSYKVRSIYTFSLNSLHHYCKAVCCVLVICQTMGKMVALFLILFASVATAQQRCCDPNQWEAIIVQSQGITNKSAEWPPIAQRIEVAIAFDYSIERAVIDVPGDDGFKIITDWTQDREYLIFRDGTCFYSQLEPEDPPKCVPDDAEFIRNTWLGLDSQQIHVDDWRMPPGDFNVTMSMLQPECVPIMMTFEGDLDEHTEMVGIQRYLNTTLGIRDPGIFEIPDDCLPSSKIQNSKFPKKHNKYIVTMLGDPRVKANNLKNKPKPQQSNSKLHNLLHKKIGKEAGM